ncbi:MAG: ribosomal protein S18-alanine N-acetyltransferase [Rubrivivax sp.]|nr:ribosomal protein S18-alanine N-acetyltransferase [Rubrivivax sp.]
MNALLQPRWERRAMTLGDLGAVLAVETAAYAHAWSRGNFVDSLAAGYRAEVLEAPDAGLVGYFVAMPGVDELHLLNVTVTPAWQGQGLGGALLDVVQAHAQERGAATLWLEVRQGNRRAQALYRRRGFVEVGLRRGYYPAGGLQREDAVVMSLALARGGAHGLE